MGKLTKRAAQVVCLASAFMAISAYATPPCDDVTKAEGCIDIPGGKGMFTVSVSYDAQTGGKSGSLKYVDTATGLTIDSSTVTDYSYLDANVRGFIFNASGDSYNEVRVFVSDWGSTGDEFEIQLLQNGTIVYDQHSTLSPDCTGAGLNGVVIASNCNDTCDCPTPTPTPTPKPQPKPHKYDYCPHHLHGKNRDGNSDSCWKNQGNNNNNKGPKGNNGVGNGIDPQPRGNPPINDGPGTGPGNPGNRGGANKK
jgi:hypothetical protein